MTMVLLYSFCGDVGLSVLETACASADAFDAYESVDGRAYAVPRRENCGSYKPDAPTKESKCVCGDLGERKKFTFTAKHPDRSTVLSGVLPNVIKS